MQLIAEEDIQVTVCDQTITVAKTGDKLEVVSEGYGHYEAKRIGDTNDESFYVDKNKVKEA